MRREEEPSWYDTAQICANGHVTNAATVDRPQHSQKFCGQCGAGTRTDCPRCGKPIRGEFHVPGVIAIGFTFTASPFCVECGAPYPWTQASLDAARELSAELHGLTEAERAELAKTLPDLVANTPRTAVAATRFKRLMLKAGVKAGAPFEKILVNVVAEAAKKILWP